MTSIHHLDTIIRTLEECNLSVSQFIISILESQHYKGHLIIEDLFMRFDDIFCAFVRYSLLTEAKPLQRAKLMLRQQYMDEIKHLSSEEGGWHFGALHATIKQLEVFSVDKMAVDMASCAPALWDLLGFLLGAAEHQPALENDSEDADGDTMMGGEPELANDSTSTAVDDSYWDAVEAIDLEGFIEGLNSTSSAGTAFTNKRQARHAAIIAIVCVSALFHLYLPNITVN